jgi:cytochrome oxidase Cu insertion factor (SCO1/SenC/PrrC family)
MGGMRRPLHASNPLIVSAFHAALLHELLLSAAVVVASAIAVNLVRTARIRGVVAEARSVPPTPQRPCPEPASRRTLRFGFGLLWVLDGLLQLQSSMLLSVPSAVMHPAASTSPQWVQHLVNSGATIWSNHPVQAAAGAVWIQVGLGIWLLVAPRGLWSRLGGMATVGWGFVIWIFGEAFGGIFAPGLTWLFGSPGAALFYCAAGVLLALPDRAFATPRLGRTVLGVTGIFFIVMAVLQAWPGRGFWQGQSRGVSASGTLTEMVRQMSHTPQPAMLSSWVAGFASFDAAHGWGTNLFIVVALAGIGAGFLSGRPRVVRCAVAATIAICLADWVLIEDLGFLGGVGTDPNSMIPMALLVVAEDLAFARLSVATGPISSQQVVASDASVTGWGALSPTYATRVIAALGAVVVVVTGTVPILLASVNQNADPILAEAFDGQPSITNAPSPPFALVDQHNEPVSLTSLRGRTVALTFLDPVCTSDCPLIAQEFRQADAMLGAAAQRVDFIAIVANPIYRSQAFTVAFDRQEGLTGVGNWFFLTGSRAELENVWIAYGAEVYATTAGAMVAHSELAFVIDGRSRTRVIMGQDQDPGATPQSSFSVLLADQIKRVLNS